MTRKTTGRNRPYERENRDERRSSRIERGMRLFFKMQIPYTLKQHRILIGKLNESETLVYYPVHGRWFISENKEVNGKGYSSLKSHLEERV